MEPINIYQAKARFSELVEQAECGYDVIIARHRKPVARLTRLVTQKRPIRFGVLKGKIEVADDFDAPLPDDLMAAFAGQ